MPTPTYLPVQSITLPGSASSVTFSSIPALSGDLVLTWRLAATTAENGGKITFNGDGGNNYSKLGAGAFGNLPGSDNYSSLAYISPHYYADIGSDWDSSTIFQIFDYASSNKYKTCLGRSSQASTERGGYMNISFWSSLSPISSITITASANAWQAGSTFSLSRIEA